MGKRSMEALVSKKYIRHMWIQELKDSGMLDGANRSAIQDMSYYELLEMKIRQQVRKEAMEIRETWYAQQLLNELQSDRENESEGIK